MNKTYYEDVTEKIIEALENGTAPWTKPWKAQELDSFAPYNPTTGKNYEGINYINLAMKSMQTGDPRFLTYKQAQNMGAQVRKGEKSMLVQYWKFEEEKNKLDESGKPVLGKNGKPIKEKIKLDPPQVFYAHVFNASQIDNMPEPKFEVTEQKFNDIAEAEKIIKNSGANITHRSGDKAFYSSISDRIVLPNKNQFETDIGYYSTALHELGHWTGHESRLDRKLGNAFGSEDYAREELRAEIASLMMASKLKMDFSPAQHHSYIDNWVSILQDKPSEIFRAASDAAKITKYLEGFGREIDKEKTQTISTKAQELLQQRQQMQPANNPHQKSKDVNKSKQGMTL